MTRETGIEPKSLRLYIYEYIYIEYNDRTLHEIDGDQGGRIKKSTIMQTKNDKYRLMIYIFSFCILQVSHLEATGFAAKAVLGAENPANLLGAATKRALNILSFSLSVFAKKKKK